MFTRRRSHSRESAVSQGTEEIVAVDIEERESILIKERIYLEDTC